MGWVSFDERVSILITRRWDRLGVPHVTWTYTLVFLDIALFFPYYSPADVVCCRWWVVAWIE